MTLPSPVPRHIGLPVAEPIPEYSLYELIGGYRMGYRYHAVAYPSGQRPILIYGDCRDNVENRMKKALSYGH